MARMSSAVPAAAVASTLCCAGVSGWSSQLHERSGAFWRASPVTGIGTGTNRPSRYSYSMTPGRTDRKMKTPPGAGS